MQASWRADGVSWQYRDDSGYFVSYSPSESVKIEGMYRAGDTSQCLSVFGRKYRFDFTQMKQVNVVSGFKRNIRRQVAAPNLKVIPYSCQATPALLEEIKDVARKHSVDCTLDGSTEPHIKLEGRDSSLFLQAVTEIQSLLLNFQAKHDHYPWPPEWDGMEGKQVRTVDLKTDSSEYTGVCSKFHKTLDKKIIRVQRVQNQWLWERYKMTEQRLRKRNRGVVNEKELFHGTSNQPAMTICSSEEGFDMRFSRQGLWGQANYFAVNASYSHRYSHRDGDHHEMVLAKVLTGDSYYCDPDSLLRMPPEKRHSCGDGQIQQVRYDSVTGHTRGSQVYMTYSNDLAYPAYIITYIKIPEVTLPPAEPFTLKPLPSTSRLKPNVDPPPSRPPLPPPRPPLRRVIPFSELISLSTMDPPPPKLSKTSRSRRKDPRKFFKIQKIRAPPPHSKLSSHSTTPKLYSHSTAGGSSSS